MTPVFNPTPWRIHQLRDKRWSLLTKLQALSYHERTDVDTYLGALKEVLKLGGPYAAYALQLAFLDEEITTQARVLGRD